VKHKEMPKRKLLYRPKKGKGNRKKRGKTEQVKMISRKLRRKK
jgi:hypothetical protein